MTALFGRLPDVAPLEEAAARALMDDCLSAAQAENCDQAVALLSEHWLFFAWLVEGSPFLCRLLKNNPDVLDALASQTPDTYFDRQIADAIAAMETATGRDAAMAILRRARNRLALACCAGRLRQFLGCRGSDKRAQSFCRQGGVAGIGFAARGGDGWPLALILAATVW